MALPEIDTVIFDLDGTLLDTEPLSTDAINRVLEPYGAQMGWTIKKKIMGMPGLAWATIVLEDLDLLDELSPQELVDRWEEEFKSLYPTVKKMHGAEELTAALAALPGLKLAIATSSNSHAVELKRKYHRDMFERFPLLVCGNDPEVKRGKPSPDIYLATAKRLGTTDPSKILVIEDALAGVQAAKAAGMSVVVVPDPLLDRSLFEAADQVLSSLTEFDYGRWGLSQHKKT